MTKSIHKTLLSQKIVTRKEGKIALYPLRYFCAKGYTPSEILFPRDKRRRDLSATKLTPIFTTTCGDNLWQNNFSGYINLSVFSLVHCILAGKFNAQANKERAEMKTFDFCRRSFCSEQILLVFLFLPI